jgi:hypothetical protein
LHQLALLKFLLLLLVAVAAVEMGAILIGAAVHWHIETTLRLFPALPTPFMSALVVRMDMVGLLILLIFLLPLPQTAAALVLKARVVSLVKVVVKAAKKVTTLAVAQVVIQAKAVKAETLAALVMLVQAEPLAEVAEVV